MIPDSVKDVINSRIDRLPASAQMVLKVASCFLDFFDKTILLAVFPVATNEPELVKVVAGCFQMVRSFFPGGHPIACERRFS